MQVRNPEHYKTSGGIFINWMCQCTLRRRTTLKEATGGEEEYDYILTFKNAKYLSETCRE